MAHPDHFFTFTVDGIGTEYAKLMTALKDGVRPDIITVKPIGDAARMSTKTYTKRIDNNTYDISTQRERRGGLAAHGANDSIVYADLHGSIAGYVGIPLQKGGARRRRSTQRRRNRRRRSTHRRR